MNPCDESDEEEEANVKLLLKSLGGDIPIKGVE